MIKMSLCLIITHITENLMVGKSSYSKNIFTCQNYWHPSTFLFLLKREVHVNIVVCMNEI